MQPMGEDTATSVLTDSLKRRKTGRPPPFIDPMGGEAAQPLPEAEEEAVGGNKADGGFVVSDEVIELLKEIEPDPDAVLRLPAQFHASQHWSQLPYAEALVSVG